jgi:pimeloyl-ACP methyl ester carboxylesterase
MKAKNIWLLVLTLALLAYPLAGCKGSNFKKGECPFELTEGLNIVCGKLTVPEDRSREDSPKIQIQVAVIKTDNPNPAPDPVLYLDGGPGGNTLEMISGYAMAFSQLSENRDLILFDQRGTGYSTPSLNCPEAENQWVQDWSMNLTSEDADQNYSGALQQCHDRLAAEGINLSAYNSAATAADVEDLRIALGYDQWNLYGISYGTKLALTVMRDYPDGVRSVILDSVLPLQVDLQTTIIPNFEISLDLVFERCAADPACAQAYPDAKANYYKLVDMLDASPLTYNVYNSKQAKFSDIYLNGDRFIWATFQMLYDSSQIPNLPWWVDTLQKGNDTAFGQTIWPIILSDYQFAEGMHYSVQCGEEIPFGSVNDWEAANAHMTPRLVRGLDTGSYFQNCSIWSVKPAGAIEAEAVISDIPTLVLSGEFDPITPPAWGWLASATLSHSQFFEFPGYSHGVSVSSSCASGMVVSFVDDPNAPVDASCVNSSVFEFKLK